MISADSLIREFKNNGQSYFKLGTVTELFANGTAAITFDGESEASSKELSYLASYTQHVVGDRVLLAKIGNTYCILGKIKYKVAP